MSNEDEVYSFLKYAEKFYNEKLDFFQRLLCTTKERNELWIKRQLLSHKLELWLQNLELSPVNVLIHVIIK